MLSKYLNAKFSLRIFVVFLSILALSAVFALVAYGENSGGETILKIESEGEEVVNLQMRLRDLGYFNYKVTGYYGTVTAEAVRYFQEVNGLKVDGTVGPETRKVLYSNEAKRCTVNSNKTSGVLPVSRGGKSSFGRLVEWFSQGQYLYAKGMVAKVTDVDTGISFYMKRTGGRNHADVEPVSKSDAEKIKKIWGGWSWDRRAIIVDVGGVRVAASMHGMPHAYDTISGNGMQGHVCIHFYKSKTHIRNSQDPDHQAMVRKAAGK